MMLGEPANYPSELVEALSCLFKTKRQVKRAWLAHVFIPERSEKGQLVAIDAGDGFGEVLAEAGVAIARDVTYRTRQLIFCQ